MFLRELRRAWPRLGSVGCAAAVLAAIATAMPGAATAQVAAAVDYDLEIRNRAVATPLDTAGGVPVIRLQQGQTVSLAWTTDEGTELHLHGYDIELPLSPGSQGFLKFKAAAAGRFAVEAHGFAGGARAAAPDDADDAPPATQIDIAAGGMSLTQLADAIVAEVKAGRGNGDQDDRHDRERPAGRTAASDDEVVLLYIEVVPR